MVDCFRRDDQLHPEPSTRPSRFGHLGEVVDQHRIPSFFASIFGLSWAFWIGVVAGTDVESLALVAIIPGAFGPPLEPP